MGKWLDLAERLEGRDKRDDRDKKAPYAPFVPSVLCALPVSVQSGLHRLGEMPVPAGVNAEEWPEVVADAGRIAADGWAYAAFALGWSAHDLFGSPWGEDADPAEQGLALWLRGRRILALTDTFASVLHAGGRAYFNRSGRSDGKLLWEIGSAEHENGGVPW